MKWLWLLRVIAGPVLRYLWALVCLPHEVHEIRHNDLPHIKGDLERLQAQVSEQKGMLDATREALGLR